MLDRSRGAALPVVGRVESLDCLAHAVLDPLRVFARVALGVVTHQDRLTEGDAIGNPARFNTMKAFFGGVGQGDEAGVWEDVPRPFPEFRKDNRRQNEKQAKKRKAEEMS